MPGFDFPNTPSVGDLFQDSSSGAVYRWNGYAWIGGVTGIGLQTIKETRYLVAGNYTFTRDPKSSGFADIHLLGACAGRPAVTWASGQVVLAAGGGAGAIGIKFRYALPASAPVVVGASASTGTSGSSSFDTVLVAPGGSAGATGTTPTATGASVAPGLGGVAPTGCDEAYVGQNGIGEVWTGSLGVTGNQAMSYLRGVARKAPAGTLAGGASLVAAFGDAGAVVVVEYLNP